MEKVYALLMKAVQAKGAWRQTFAAGIEVGN